MNLRDLRYLVALADHKHFGRAAEASFVSQPTLSTQLKKFEDEIGMALVERNPRNVMLTEVGEAVVAKARIILREADEIKAIARRAKDPESGTVRLGIFPTLGPYLLPHIVPNIVARFPKLELILVEEKTEVLLKKLHDGELDAAILALPIHDDTLHAEFLFEESFVLAINKQHKLAKANASSFTTSPKNACYCWTMAIACATRRWRCARWRERASAPASAPRVWKRCATWSARTSA